MNRSRVYTFALGLLLSATPAVAQYELKAGNFNQIFVPQNASGASATPYGPPVAPGPTSATNPLPTDRQFSAMGQVSGAAGPLSSEPPSATYSQRYPGNGTLVLARATIGGVFASGVPRFSLGEVITTPLAQIDGVTTAGSNYWRTEPVGPGEIFKINNANTTLFPIVNVTVSSASTSTTVVTVVSPPASLVVGATILGQPIAAIVGTTVTLAGNANASISSATSVPITPETPYYYSPHAEKVFASQAGRVTITWVTRAPDANGNYYTKTEDFAVSLNTVLPIRTIYWTDGAFDGPPVTISDTRVTTVKPAYYSGVPKAVAQAVTIPGTESSTTNLKTLYFDTLSGPGQLHAYNVEGRIFIEYLGNTRIGDDIYEHLGSDVVEIVRVPEANYNTVLLGKEIGPHEPGVSVAAPTGTGTTAKVSATLSKGIVTGINLIDGGSGYGTTAPIITFPAPSGGVAATASATVSNGMVTSVTLVSGGSGYPVLTPIPVQASGLSTVQYYGTSTRPDSSIAYFAERETSAVNSPDNGAPASQDAYNKVIFYWMEEGNFSIQWPKFQDRYWLRWSPNLQDYAHYTVENTGGASQTGMLFSEGSLPMIAFQDDPNQTEAAVDLSTQRFTVNFAANSDRKNRSLLKFIGLNALWYLNVYTQGESRSLALSSTSTTSGGVTTVTVADTVGLEVGMVVSGTGITDSAIITRIIDGTRIVISQNIANATNTLTYTVESDMAAAINTTATVGTRLAPPSGHENAGYISSGTAYYPAGYINPFVSGVTAANLGAIIPVNARPTDRQLTVRWFKKISPPTTRFSDIYVPGKIGRYTISYPATTSPQIVIAQGVGTGDLSGAESIGTVYYQNDSSLPGYNPNEEHAFPLPPRAYALRDDLNITTTSGYTSEPFVLMAYTDAVDNRPAMHAYKVVRTDGTYDFDYTATAGTLLVKPYPLPLMPIPMVGTGINRNTKDIEILGADQPANATVSTVPAYKGFTYKDRKGFTWIHRGPHDAADSPTLTMKLYYLSREGFYVPGMATQPAEGTVMPFLRAADRKGTALSLTSIDAASDGTGQIDQPLAITYRPAWPTDAPELGVGETLALPKFGLPQVRGQATAEVLYQQSIAEAATATLWTKNSVTLHDPTRQKTVALNHPSVALTALPAALKTTAYDGKTYFQGLPPHLQQRFYLDPSLSVRGSLVLNGTFHDEIAGEDYFDLNLVTEREEALLKDLVPAGSTGKSNWDTAIETLNTVVETLKPDPARFGSYILDSTKQVGENDLAVIENPDTLVDSYAVTATGKGAGYVTMVFGNSRNTDRQPEGDPVQVKVFKVATQLYVGDLKVVQSSNPLDEQVTLRHSGDFAGKPEDYEFDWRWTTGAATAPGIYTEVMTTRIGNAVTPTNRWRIVSDPGEMRMSYDQYLAATAVPLPRSVNVRPETYTAADIAASLPSVAAIAESNVSFPGGVPDNIVFSAEVGNYDGFVLYVNQVAVLAYNAPASGLALTTASSGLTATGLTKQFSIPRSYFRALGNTIEVSIYTSADTDTQSALDFKLEAAQETDIVTSGGVWQSPSDPTGINTNTALVGSSSTLPFGGPQFVLNDRWFTMRYRPKASSNIIADKDVNGDYVYSRWMPPQFVEGWVKRVLAAINPFEQRVKDLYNNSANTDVSVITQAGKRWEGDIALTMDNVNDVGLIEIYETVLNRAKDMSIDANTNDPDSNNALTLAAGYLNDLYTILGNEAYADAANPTISLDDQTGVTEVNTSRFSFEGQVASSLDEELAMLRGRDDFTSPGVSIAPGYNRLYWNYTRGINSGEVIYAINYNVKEKVGSSTADGVIDEADAQRMFPQGHGDSYGHYLTALTGYYKLLTNNNFSWTPRAEAVTVLGQPVTVDYMDERKFAAAAGNVARAAQQICNLVFRKSYKDDPSAGWSSYRDSKGTNTQTGNTSRQGLDEWVSRGSQGALYHWAVANALVPDVDNFNTGVQKIDRTTVPEIAQLASTAETLQTTIDNANSHLNPLGLSAGAIAFDISPAEMKAGKSHFEQIYDRSLRSLVNANGAFTQAGKMTRALRNQQNQMDDYNTVIVQQETAYVNQLIDIYGEPYAGDIGAGKVYAQGYSGPDTERWFIIDRPSDLVDTSTPVQVTMRVPTQVTGFSGNSIPDVLSSFNRLTTVEKTVTVTPNRFAQYSNVIAADGSLGARTYNGTLQGALLDSHIAQLSLQKALAEFQVKRENATRKAETLERVISFHRLQFEMRQETALQVNILTAAARLMDGIGQIYESAIKDLNNVTDATIEAMPTVVGVASDPSFAARGVTRAWATATNSAFSIAVVTAEVSSAATLASADVLNGLLLTELRKTDLSLEEIQLAYEVEAAHREFMTMHYQIAELTAVKVKADQRVINLQSEGSRVLAEREVFRQRAAAIIQGYRTKDLGFRIFRNEALEQYRTLFDLASRYSYLAAKSYDYETGLLGTTQGQTIFARIVASRSLGDLTGGVPQSTVSTLGDSGLAGTMAQLNADFSVAKGRLGINNPDQYGTVFSLRGELFRLLNDPTITSDDDAWRQTLEQHMVPNVLSDSDVATYCLNIKKPNGTPVPGIIIPFSTTIQHGKNFFGLDLAAGDHAYTPSSFATKIYGVGIALPGYVGMDNYASGTPTAGGPASGASNALSATPYVYLIPCGNDFMLAPPLGDTNTLRSWNVKDQALPLPYNLGANDFSGTQFFDANGTLTEQPWILRKHQAFRMIKDATAFYSLMPNEFTNGRLVGRSVWNNQWKIVIPAYTLLNNEQDGLNRFAASVKDVELFLRTYSNSGN